MSSEAKPAQPILRTERLLLRKPVESDIPDLVALANDREITRWSARMPYPYTEAAARFFFDAIIPHERVWAITLPEEDRFMGAVGLMPRKEPGAVEVGYWIGARYKGNGYVTEAARAVIAHAFEGGAQVICAGYFAGNAASRRILEKIGFVETGRGELMNVTEGRPMPDIEMQLTLENFKR